MIFWNDFIDCVLFYEVFYKPKSELFDNIEETNLDFKSKYLQLTVVLTILTKDGRFLKIFCSSYEMLGDDLIDLKKSKNYLDEFPPHNIVTLFANKTPLRIIKGFWIDAEIGNSSIVEFSFTHHWEMFFYRYNYHVQDQYEYLQNKFELFRDSVDIGTTVSGYKHFSSHTVKYYSLRLDTLFEMIDKLKNTL